MPSPQKRLGIFFARTGLTVETHHPAKRGRYLPTCLQHFIGDLDIVTSLELFLERNAFLAPYERSPFSIAGVRKVHDVDIFDVVEELVHLLLAVARGFANDQVGKVRKGAVFAYSKSVGTFNKRADVFREMLFCYCISCNNRSWLGCLDWASAST